MFGLTLVFAAISSYLFTYRKCWFLTKDNIELTEVKLQFMFVIIMVFILSVNLSSRQYMKSHYH